MSIEQTSAFQYFYETNIQTFQRSLKYFQKESYRQFCQYMISNNGTVTDWLQLMGFNTTIHMTYRLLQETFTPEQIQKTAIFSGLLNSLYIYETMSDNVALGLGTGIQHRNELAERKEILRHFSEAMISKLQGNPCSPDELLKPIQALCDKVSIFEQSLNTPQHNRLFEQYRTEYPHIQRKDVEYSLYDILLANMHCAVDTCAAFTDEASREFFTDSLLRRYQGQLFLLINDEMTVDDALDASTGSIAAVPAMFYYIGYYLNTLEPNPAYHQILHDNSLKHVLDLSSLSVRLLNDVGTNVLTLSELELEGFRNAFQVIHFDSPTLTFKQLLQQQALDNPVLYARFHKDIAFGEFNLAIHFAQSLPPDEAIIAFFKQIELLSTIYHQSLQDLQLHLHRIDAMLNNPIVSHVVWAFVHFHQKLYSHVFQIPEGEYAI